MILLRNVVNVRGYILWGALSASVMLNEVKHLANERNQRLLLFLAQILRYRSG